MTNPLYHTWLPLSQVYMALREDAGGGVEGQAVNAQAAAPRGACSTSAPVTRSRPPQHGPGGAPTPWSTPWWSQGPGQADTGVMTPDSEVVSDDEEEEEEEEQEEEEEEEDWGEEPMPQLQLQQEEEEETPSQGSTNLTVSVRLVSTPSKGRTVMVRTLAAMLEKGSVSVPRVKNVMTRMSSRSMLWRSLRYLRRSLVYINQYYGQGITAGMLSDMSTLLDLPASYPHGLLEGETQTALPPIPCSPQQPEDMVTKVAALMPWVGKLMSYENNYNLVCRRGRDGFFFYTSPLFTRLFFSAEEITRLMHSLHWAIFWVWGRLVVEEDGEALYKGMAETSFNSDLQSELTMLSRCVFRDGSVRPCLIRVRMDHSTSESMSAVLFCVRELITLRPRLHGDMAPSSCKRRLDESELAEAAREPPC